MNIINRYVCKTEEKCDLDKIEKIINKQQYYESSAKKESADYILKSFIELKHKITTPEINFCMGTYYFEYEDKVQIPNITKTSANLKEETIKKSHVLDFWITDDKKILFSKSCSASKKGKSEISALFFGSDDKITAENYNIEKIELAVENGEFEGMWTTVFKGRQGKIGSGAAFGDDINTDSMYSEMDGSTKNGVGIKHKLQDEYVKIKINRKGTIQIPGKSIDNDNREIFKVIGSFDNYIIK